MIFSKRKSVGTGVLTLVLFWTGHAIAQTSSAGSFFETISRTLSRIGDKTQELLAPAFGPVGGNEILDFRDKTVARRELVRHIEAPQGTTLFVANEFGHIEIETWREPVVQVRAEILAGAQTFDLAQQLANAIDVQLAATEKHIDVRTRYPDMREIGDIAKTVNCKITLPAFVSVECTNNFGDIRIKDVQAPVVLDCRYGAVELQNIGGTVRARARGEFPLRVNGLKGGGTFELWRTQAEFRNVSQNLKVLNFFGTITIDDLSDAVEADITNDSGPIRVVLADDKVPDVQASVFFGSLKSDIPMNPTTSGDLISGRSTSTQSNQRLFLSTTFGDIEIVRREKNAAAPQQQNDTAGDYMESTLPEIEQLLAEGTPVVIDLEQANVRIEGVDENHVQVTGSQVMRMKPGSDPRLAAEALTLRLEPAENGLRVIGKARDNLEALGCTYYRFELQIKCPRTSPVSVKNVSGVTTIRGLGDKISIEQTEGRVTIENCKSPMEIHLARGDLQINECAGPVTATVDTGNVSTRKVFESQTITAGQGKTVLDSPGNGLTVRQRGGDVRLLPLDGILGDFDVKAEGGNISILIPDSSDAVLLVTARNGNVRTAYPLTGEIGRDFQRLQGRLRPEGEGKYRVVLETVGGDIIVD
ncbi:MAG TPA: DUF4097 family beta strand repeat-containing protein [Candidatus Hydrogenedentes bacterium]|nr:DUF4097 family beta strand repeat-containing protein [Candidatus Hydrogenedentota bacterium]HOL77317.1 DUF4097 family beta strand repeat-containing protein [Candidatus Hydrogenedentota bacterium]